MDTVNENLASMLKSIEGLTNSVKATNTSLDELKETASDTNGKVSTLTEEMTGVKNDLSVLTKKQEKLAKRLQKTEEKSAKNAINNGMIRKEQYNIKVAVERLHQLVEKNREESVRDKIEAKAELRNVIFNNLPKKLLNREYGGGKSAKEMKRYAYDLICDITDIVRDQEVLAAHEMGRPNKKTFRLKIEMSSQYLAETIANLGTANGYNCRQGMLKSERDFLAAQHKLADALNERNTSRPEYYFAVRRGTRLVLKSKETDEIVQDVPVPTSEELADCLVKFDLPIYADLAEGPEDEDEVNEESADEEELELDPEAMAARESRKKQLQLERAGREVARAEARQERERLNLDIRKKSYRARPMTQAQSANHESEPMEEEPPNEPAPVNNEASNLGGESVVVVEDGAGASANNGAPNATPATPATQDPNDQGPATEGNENETTQTSITTIPRTGGKRKIEETVKDGGPPPTPASKKTKKGKKATVESDDESDDDEVIIMKSKPPAKRGTKRGGRGGGKAGTSSTRGGSSGHPKMPNPARHQPNRSAKNRTEKRGGGGSRRGGNQRRQPVMSAEDIHQLMFPLAGPPQHPNGEGSSLA